MRTPILYRKGNPIAILACDNIVDSKTQVVMSNKYGEIRVGKLVYSDDRSPAILFVGKFISENEDEEISVTIFDSEGRPGVYWETIKF